MATFEMAPTCNVIVYRFNKKEIISAMVPIPLNEDLNNYLKLKLSAQKTKPGENVTIDILTNPKSYVGLLGVDQSVLLLRKNEGLTHEEAMRELEYRHSSVYRPDLPEFVYRFSHFQVSFFSKFKSEYILNNKNFEY